MRMKCVVAMFLLTSLSSKLNAEVASPVVSEQAQGNQQNGGSKRPPVENEQVLPVGRPPEKKQEPQPLEATTTIFDQGGVLTPRGIIIVEPSIQYSHSSTNRIAVVGYTVIPTLLIGSIDIRSVERNTFVYALSVRYGLTNRIEAEVKVPYVYRTDSSSTQSVGNAPDNVFSANGSNIGDVEFGLRYQLNNPTAGGPYYILGLRGKSNTGKDSFEVPLDTRAVDAGGTGLPTELPTGSGFWGVQPSLSVIFPSDPAVIFGGVSYLWNIDRNDIPGKLVGVSDAFARVDPGDVIGFNFGLGLSLNEKTSLSLGYDHSVVGKVKINNNVAPGSLITQVGSLLIGYSYKYSDNTNIGIALGAGLTQAAPDVQLTIRVPFTI